MQPSDSPIPRDASHMVRLSKKARGRLGRDCSSAPESVELLGKERSSDQCHMMQEVCQHFSSSSLAKGRGMHALAAGERQIMEASHEPGDAPRGPFFYVGEFVCSSCQQLSVRHHSLPASNKLCCPCKLLDDSFFSFWKKSRTTVNLSFSLLLGYLSCCRFLDDNQIVTSSGDTTW